MSRARDLAKAGGVQQRLVGFSSHVGISTFAADVVMSGDLAVAGDLNVTGDLSYDQTTASNQRITGISTLNQVQATTVQVSAGLTAATAQISDLTSGRVVVAGTNGELGDSGNLTFSGGTLTATTFSGNLPTSDLTGTITNAQLAGSIANDKLSNSSATVTAGDALTGGGTLTLGSSVTLNVGVDDSSIEVSSDALQVKAAGVTNAMLAGSIANSKLSNSSVAYGGVTLSLGTADTTPAFNLADATGLPVSSGIDGLGSGVASFLATPSSSNLRAAVTGETGSGALVFGTSPTISTPAITGGSFTGRQEIADAAVSGGFIVGAGLTVTGDLVVNGTTTTINSTTISVDDKHIELGATANPTDSSADGGGLILKGDTDHTLLWHNDNDHWQSSEHFNLASGKTYQIADTSVLSATTLGANVVNSSLTSVGTISSGTWQGTAIENAYLANSTMSVGGVTLTLGATDSTPAFDLSDGINYPTSSLDGTITNAQLSGDIANSKLVNSEITLGGVTISLGGEDATPAFNLSDATSYPTSSLTGTITNAQLAGSIAASKLAGSIGNSLLSNSSVSFGGITVALGASDATPAFDLSDATGLPISSGVSGLASNVATFLATPSSSNLRSVVTDETGSGSLVFATNPSIAGMTVSDDVVPNANGTINLGASGTRFANVFSSDLDLSNEAKGVNTVDGTWGSYLIEEGEEHLYITNRRSGKKFRFMLEEV